MEEERVTTAVWVRQIVDAISSTGLDGAALCQEAGLDPAQLATPEGRFSNDVIGMMWELAAAQSGNPAIGLVAARSFKPAALDAVGYAMMSSADLRGALERAIRYSRILSSATTAALVPLAVGARFELTHRAGTRPLPRAGGDFVLLTLLRFFRWIAEPGLAPLAVELPDAAPGDARPYADAFGCALRFAAPRPAFVFSHADLARPLATSNPLLSEVLDRHAEQRLEQLATTGIAPRAQRLIAQALPDGEPARSVIAGTLGMSASQLQRRLRAEGTSFQELLDTTRRGLAERYLARPTLSLIETAYLLGFADQTSLARASRRWFAASPRKLRSRRTFDHAGSATDPGRDEP